MSERTPDRSGVRATQRPPRACIYCSSRKIRCDKVLPCSTCRARGQAETCRVETVRVKGRILSTDSEDGAQPSYTDLLEQTKKLKTLLWQQQAASTPPSARDGGRGPPPGSCYRMNTVEEFEKQLYRSIRSSYRYTTVHTTSEILFPSAQCARLLLRYGMQWMWIHSAVDQATFDREVTTFLDKCRIIEPVQAAEPAWLALYFAYLTCTLLMMTDEEKVRVGLPYTDANTVLGNWYDATEYFLNKAQFMRVVDIRNVQTIAILKECCPHFADFNRFYHLLACAVRTSQVLELSNDNAHPDETAHETQVRRRLWWSLIIGDWLTFQLGPACIQGDFFVEMPTDMDDRRLEPSYEEIASLTHRPIQWFIAMSRIACALYRFHSSLPFEHEDRRLLLDNIQQADEELANLISTLPPHLQADEAETSITVERDKLLPWIPWQRRSITVMLFYFRMVIHRTLLKYDCGDVISKKRAVTICQDSAHGIMSTILGPQGVVFRQNVW
ncbi:hypothetical protein P154DRAFT_450946 [Amniculicola lignicola CBS 123094]|uniref:Zn(2)-C6 fungal-type domain-containing protein n=1 Tax=Amniculicola lignicola CBS 123094 TaxID=1392246 RepID=A0A6A5VUV0_9PLEO|nr:hypothetical protein P154DRAFT_450946 [Amniculicola lignicola CBS 123094]